MNITTVAEYVEPEIVPARSLECRYGRVCHQSPVWAMLACCRSCRGDSLLVDDGARQAG
jgi:hypothetical protein